MVRRSLKGPLRSVTAGVVLTGWIVGEVLILNQPVEPTWIEVVFAGNGALMALFGWMAVRSSGRSPAP
jgi:hypothetical protein